MAAAVPPRVASRLGGAAVGLLLDRFLGEPPAAWHPVARFGALMERRERRHYRDSRPAGVGHLLWGTGLALALGVAGERAAGAAAVAAATGLAASGRMLGEQALAVGDALGAADLATARALLPALVGRDPSSLDGAEISRAVVESTAENTVDAVVASAVWAALAGAPGVLAHRAVNTLDAMVGHRSARYARFGWASARLDDAAAWLPARLTAVLVALVRPRRARDVGRAVRHQAGAHPSPNAGVAEAAFAAALGRRLGGVNRYGDRVEVRPALGWGPPAGPADIRRAVRLADDVTLALGLSLAGLAAATARTGRRRRLAGGAEPGSRPRRPCHPAPSSGAVVAVGRRPGVRRRWIGWPRPR